MESDILDRQIAHALQVSARAPFSRIAQVIGVSDQTVARRYARLRSDGTLRVLGLVDPVALGEVRWLVRVRCTPDAAAPLAEAIARREDTMYVNLTSGATEICFTTRARPGFDDRGHLLQRLPRTASVVDVTAHCVLHTFFGAERSLVSKSASLSGEQVDALREVRPRLPARHAGDLGEAEQRLLAALAVDGRAPLAELAAVTGWSPSTVRRRMEELEDSGVLYYDLDFDFGLFGVTAVTMLWMSVAPADLAATGEALAAHQDIGYATATTGPTNLHAVLLSRNFQGLYEYLTTEVAALDAVRQVESAPVMRMFKGPGPVPMPLRRLGR